MLTHREAIPMQPLTATAAKSPEDIDAVLGRFQVWSATRKATSPKTKGLPEGVRELSYEEALESSRNRWQARTQPSVMRDSTEEITTSADRKSVSEVTHDEAAPEAFPTQTAFDTEAIQPDRLSLSATAISPASHGIDLPQKAQPAFGTVLAEAIPCEPDPAALALVWPAPPKTERQVSMSLRVAASEQALIKARAAEAGLSVSAYLRQCALEVEKLRAQVHHTLALIEQKSEQSPARNLGSPPSPIRPDGFFARLGQLFFGSPARVTLRA